MPLPRRHQCGVCGVCELCLVQNTSTVTHDFVAVLHPPPLHASHFFCIFFYPFSSAFILSFLIHPFKSFLFKIPLFSELSSSPMNIFPVISCYPVHVSFTISSLSVLSSIFSAWSFFLYSPSSSHLVFFPHLISWPSQSHPFLHHFLHMKFVLPDFPCTLLPVILSFPIFLFLSPFFHFHPCDSMLPYPFRLFCIPTCPPSLVSYPPVSSFRLLLLASWASFSVHPPLPYSSLSQLTALSALALSFLLAFYFRLILTFFLQSPPCSLSTSVFYPFLHWWNGLTVWWRLIELPHKHSFSHIPSLDSPPFEGDVLWGFVCCTAVWQFDTHIHT